MYEVVKDAVKLAQQANNVELIQKLLDVQKDVLDMQNELQTKNEEILALKDQIRKISERDEYEYEGGHKWLVNPRLPDIKLCPTCMNRDGFESPLGVSGHLGHRYCGNCKNSVN